MNRSKIKFGHRIENATEISDLFDGTIFQNFAKSFDAYELDYIFTMMLNTDGISVSDKSNLSIWPVYLNITEIEKSERFCLENTIIAGFYKIISELSV